MTFPVITELFYDSAWNDISADIRVEPGVEIQWGRSDGAGSPEPSQLSLTINNRTGKYSPRNPLSPLYGKIGRNTPIRVTISGTQAFIGEVSSWPTRWNLPGTDSYMPIEAAGILRRLQQGNQPAPSGLQSTYMATTPITYFPLTDGPTSTSGAPAAGTYQASNLSPTATIGGFKGAGAGVLAAFGVGYLTDYLSPVLRIDDTVDVGGGGFGAPDGYFSANTIGSSATPDGLAWEYVWRADTAVSEGLNMGVLTFYAVVEGGSGTYNWWVVSFRRGGGTDDMSLGLVLDATSASPTTVALGDTGVLAAVTDGLFHHVRLQVTQNGANVDYAVYLDGTALITGTRNTYTLRRAYSLAFDYNRDGTLLQDRIALGHVIVWETTANIPAIADTYLAASAFLGEVAGRRIERLCAEEGVAFVAGGDLDDTMPMGLQYEDYFANQLAEVEQTDMGLISESRTALELVYTPRRALYTLTPTATINYENTELSAPFEPTDDDQVTRNDVFAQRREGGSARVTVETGPLSVQDPPDGVGRYKDEYQVNCQTDGFLEGVAAWRVRLGTVDAARFPSVTVERGNPAVAVTGTGLSTLIRSVDVGDLLRITGGTKLRATGGIYDNIDLLVLGGRVWTDGTLHTLTFNCAPYEPYAVAEFDTDRYDTAGSTLASGVTSTGTSLSVASPSTLWTTAGGSFPFDITVAGERMTVTTISGASSPQTFTVVRSVNGVVKAQSSGAAVRLFKTPRYGL